MPSYRVPKGDFFVEVEEEQQVSEDTTVGGAIDAIVKRSSSRSHGEILKKAMFPEADFIQKWDRVGAAAAAFGYFHTSDIDADAMDSPMGLLVDLSGSFIGFSGKSGPSPQTATTVDVQGAKRFSELAASWIAETQFSSSPHEMVMHLDYQRIIGLGPPVLPLVLDRLRKQPHRWLWALAAIAGENPAADASTLAEATEAWLAWGRARNLIDA